MKPYPALLAELLSEELSSLRQQKALTQEAMAEQLRISSRAYSDLERGRYAASAPTLLFLFSMLEADAQSALVQQFMTWQRCRPYSARRSRRRWRGRMQHERRNRHCRSI